MQGSQDSSLAIWTAFDDMTTATWRPLKWALKVAWRRAFSNTATWAVVGTSLVDGVDLVQGQSTIVTKPDLFDYYDETDNVIQIEYERELIEPLGGMAMAQGDVVLQNTGFRFTPNYNQTVGTALLPNRPINYHIGFEVKSVSKTIPIMKGLTDTPREDKKNRVCKIHCFDYLKYINQYQLESTTYTNQRTDQIIDDILTTIGFTSDQYALDTGLNTIGFAWFTKGTKAGEAIRKICESEEGVFYQDESGILRFENRRHFTASPHATSQWTIQSDDIIEWAVDDSVDIINRCTVIARPREAQSTQEIWRDGIVEEIATGDTLTVWASFENPATSIVSPASTTDYVANTASDGTGTDKTSSVTVTLTSFTDTAKLEITNNHSGTVYMTLLRLRGTPAIVTSEIEQIYQDDDSVAKYETQALKIENDFIDDNSFAYYLARAIVRKYKDPLRRIKIRVRGIPQLQLRDKVTVHDRDLDTNKDYRVMKIKGTLQGHLFYQDLTLREVTALEADNWATVGTSTVDGADVVGN